MVTTKSCVYKGDNFNHAINDVEKFLHLLIGIPITMYVRTSASTISIYDLLVYSPSPLDNLAYLSHYKISQIFTKVHE